MKQIENNSFSAPGSASEHYLRTTSDLSLKLRISLVTAMGLLCGSHADSAIDTERPTACEQNDERAPASTSPDYD